MAVQKPLPMISWLSSSLKRTVVLFISLTTVLIGLLLVIPFSSLNILDLNPGTENFQVRTDCFPVNNSLGLAVSPKILRVYMYNLPRKFHFGLFTKRTFTNPENELPWNDSMPIPPWPGANRTSKHQHSVAYYLMADLLVKHEDAEKRTIAVRVLDPGEADVFFVPFFATLCYNKFGNFLLNASTDHDEILQRELVSTLLNSPWWQKSGGSDHVIPTTHPNSMRFARKPLRNAVFVLVDFGRQDLSVARLTKDVVTPYNHLMPRYREEDEVGQGEVDVFAARTSLLYFQGTIKRKQGGRIRTQLFRLLEKEKDVHFQAGKPNRATFNESSHGMRSSKFCLHPAGDTPSSCRLFDAIMSGCVPVVVSDYLDLPFEDMIDYSQFTMFVAEKDAVKAGHLLNLLRNVKKEEWMQKWHKLSEVQRHFEFTIPSSPYDAVDLIWRQIHDKLPQIRLSINRNKRILVPDWWSTPKPKKKQNV